MGVHAWGEQALLYRDSWHDMREKVRANVTRTCLRVRPGLGDHLYDAARLPMWPFRDPTQF
jgi:hypothetical protein